MNNYALYHDETRTPRRHSLVSSIIMRDSYHYEYKPYELHLEACKALYGWVDLAQEQRQGDTRLAPTALPKLTCWDSPITSDNFMALVVSRQCNLGPLMMLLF
jgi:hypothetical protein